MGGFHAHHSHEHAHQNSGRVLFTALLLTGGFALLEAVGGWLAGSLALLGDAAHMVTDATALGLAAFAAWLAGRPPSARHSYGLLRAEVIAALVNGLTMLAVVVGIVLAAIERFRHPHDIDGFTVIWIALAGLVVNILVAWLLSRGEQTLNTRAALLHVLGDLLGSVAALLSGLAAYYAGWFWIDPVVSVLICVLIAISTVRLLREALHVVMEGVPLHLSLEEVGTAMAAQPGIHSVHDLHIWTLASGKLALSAHLVVERLDQWPQILHRQREMLEQRFGIDHITLQPELPAQVAIQWRDNWP